MSNNETKKIEIQNLKKEFFTIFNELEKNNRNILNEYVNYSLSKIRIENIDYKLVETIIKDKDKCDKFDKLFEIHNYIMSSNEPFDLLGQLLMGVHKRGTKGYKGNTYKGQFFTDSIITDFVSEISLIRKMCSYSRDKEKFQSIKVIEPSSGTGSMIISMIKNIRNKDIFFEEKDYEFTVVEYDYETSLCLLLQMLLLKINVKVVHGDSIKKEVFQQWNIGTFYV